MCVKVRGGHGEDNPSFPLLLLLISIRSFLKIDLHPLWRRDNVSPANELLTSC